MALTKLNKNIEFEVFKSRRCRACGDDFKHKDDRIKKCTLCRSEDNQIRVLKKAREERKYNNSNKFNPILEGELKKFRSISK